MEVYILDPVVRQNVRLLMHIVQDALKQSEGNIKRVERVYSLVINRKTGEFQEVSDRRLSGDWPRYKPWMLLLVESPCEQRNRQS